MRTALYLALLASSAAVASPPIEGAFGYKLGEIVSPDAFLAAGAHAMGNGEYEFTTMNGIVGVQVNRFSRIFVIAAAQQFTGEPACLKQSGSMEIRMTKKYSAQVSGSASSWKIAIGGRTMTGTCSPVGRGRYVFEILLNDANVQQN